MSDDGVSLFNIPHPDDFFIKRLADAIKAGKLGGAYRPRLCPHGIDLDKTCERCYHERAVDPE